DQPQERDRPGRERHETVQGLTGIAKAPSGRKVSPVRRGMNAYDVHAAIIQSPEIEVITPGGGTRRKPNTITVNDTLKFKSQRTFFHML
ncbi:hypothetical protein ACTXY2_33450, partial [Pseudomonas aeruginosa]